MKNLKLPGLAAVAAMALMAFAAGSASAGVLYSGTTKLGSGATIDFSIPSGSSAVLVDTNGEELDKCAASTVQGSLSTSATATGSINILSWSSCTFPTTTVTPGKLQVIGGTGTEATVKADATIEVTINTIFFGSCIYGASTGTVLGTLHGKPATFVANAVVSRSPSTPFWCPETAKWTGTYNSTEPSELHVERE